ncbi:MAG: hypothetical protein U1E20_14225 [Methylocystis sp.]
MPESLIGLGVAAFLFLVADNLVHAIRARRMCNGERRGYAEKNEHA